MNRAGPGSGLSPLIDPSRLGSGLRDDSAYSLGLKTPLVRPKLRDDSAITSPYSLGLNTPPVRQRLSDLSGNSTFRNSGEATSLSNRSSYRQSMGSVRRQSRLSSKYAELNESSSNRASMQRNLNATEAVTKEQAVFDDFKILKDDLAPSQEKIEARERLIHIFSMEKGLPYVASLVKKLTAQYHRLTYELGLAAVTRGIIANLISEKTLYLECCWHEFVIEVAERISKAIGGTYSSSGQSLPVEIVQSILHEKKDYDELYSFLTVKMKDLNLVGSLSNKTAKDLEAVVKSVKDLKLVREHLFSKCAIKIIEAVFERVTCDKVREQDKLYSSINNVMISEVNKYVEALQAFQVTLISSRDIAELQCALHGYFIFRVNKKLWSEFFLNDTVITTNEEFAALKSAYQDVVLAPMCVHSVDEYANARIEEAVSEFHSSKLNALTATNNATTLDYEQQKAALKKASNSPEVIEQAERARDDYRLFLETHPKLKSETLATISNSSIEQQKAIDGLHEEIERSVHESIDAVDEQIRECELHLTQMNEQLQKHAVYQTNRNRSSSAPAIVSESISVLCEDEDRKNALNHAIECKEFAIIATILTNAKASDVLVELLSATLPKLDEEGFKLLVGGAYLFDPKGGGLYNPAFVKELCDYSQQQNRESEKEERYSEVDGAAAMKSSLRPQSIFQKVEFFFTDQHQPQLSREEQIEINTQVLKEADDKNLALIIEQVGSGKWPHPVTYSALDLRAELKRRFVKTSECEPPESIDDYVRVHAALTANLKIAERGERLAAFYDKETRHVLASYSSSNKKGQEVCAGKAKVILEEFAKSAEKAKALEALEEEAKNIASAFANPNSPLNERRPGFISDPRSTSKTQRMFAAAYDTLTATGVSGTLWQGAVNVAQSLTGSERQNDKSVLVRPIEDTVDNGLSEALLNKIPLTPQEKHDCVKRATLARGVFKNTLEYLENRYTKENSKRKAVENHIQDYVNGTVTAEALIDGLKNTTATKQQAWLGLWAKSGRLMHRDLANERAFTELGPKTVAAGC